MTTLAIACARRRARTRSGGGAPASAVLGPVASSLPHASDRPALAA